MKRDAILTCDQNPNCCGVSAAVDADTTNDRTSNAELLGGLVSECMDLYSA